MLNQEAEKTTTFNPAKYKRIYDEQRRIQHYQNERVIARPETTYFVVIIWALIGLVFVAGILLSIILVEREAWIAIIYAIFMYLFFFELFGRFFGIKIVECYQHYASEGRRRRCLCVPSCSEYAILCFKKYGLIFAILKIRKRLFVTCKGAAYIIDNP